MKLYLLRHAIACARDPHRFPDDDARPLTRRGRVRMRVAAGGLRKLGIEPKVIHSSPLVRAKQTAEIVAAAMKPKAKVRVAQALAPGRDPFRIFRSLRDKNGRDEVVLVGHEPDLSKFAGLLLSGAPAVMMKWKKGGLCCIELPETPAPGGGRLLFQATPRMLRMLGSRKP